MTKITKYGLFLVLGAGVALRMKEYLVNRSLWVDEAVLALNIIHKSYRNLMGSLDYLQHAPISFLWMEKLMISMFGTSEYALRVFPLACSIVALFLFYKLATRMLSQTAAFVALTMFAFSGMLIHYAAEMKQYSWDSVVVLVLYLTLLPKRSMWYRVLIGVITAWIVHPAIFILAGIGLSDFFQSVQSKNHARIYKSAALSVIWAASFGLFYLLFLRGYFGNTTFLSYWPYVILVPTTIQDLLTNLNGIIRIFQTVGGSPSNLIGIVLFVIGGVSIWKRKPYRTIALLSPLLMTWVASGLHLYPLADRLWLFLTPSIIMSVAEGAIVTCGYVYKQQSIYGKGFAWISIGVLLYGSLVGAAFTLVHPVKFEEARPIVTYLSAHKQSGDRVYVYYGAIGAFRYYSERFGVPETQTTIGIMSRDNWQRYLDDLSALRGFARVWVVFSHTYVSLGYQGGRIIDEEQFMIQYLDSTGRRLDELHVEGASIYLYDLSSDIR